MAFGTGVASSAPVRQEPPTSPLAWRLLYAAWILRLFRPEWVLAYFVPPLGFLRMLPTLLLAALVGLWLQAPKKRFAELKWLAVFFVFSAVTATFSENIGRGMPVVRFTFELCAFGACMLVFVDTVERTKALFQAFMGHLVYMAIWGVLGGGLVRWDNVLNEEDAFGPLMCLGAGFFAAYLDAKHSKGTLLGYVSCVVGVVASFARGAFLALSVVLAYSLVTSKQVLRNILLAVCGAGVIAATSALLFEKTKGGENPFWNEMATISGGVSEGTGKDRAVLWAVAWEIFKDNPIAGVGPQNFGIAAPRYVERVEDRGELYNDPASIWGRALHNGYFQILSEGGLIGVFLFLAIFVSFLRSNFKTRRASREARNGGAAAAELGGLARAVSLGMFAYLLNLFFYDLTYYNWFWDFILLNALLGVQMERLGMTADAVPAHSRGLPRPVRRSGAWRPTVQVRRPMSAR